MWRRIATGSHQGWEYRSRGKTLATLWRLKDLDTWGVSRDRRYGIFINGRRKGPAFLRRWQAMQFAQEHMMGWICSQFRIAGYVFAEVKQRKRTRKFYFVTRDERSQDYDEIAQAFEAAEEAVLDLIHKRAWMLSSTHLTMNELVLDYVPTKRKSRRPS